MVDQSQSVIPTPPRLTGDYQADSVTIREWMQAFYNGFAASGFIPSTQFAAPPAVDPNNLPAPTDTTIAKAQATANAAIEALKAHSLYP